MSAPHPIEVTLVFSSTPTGPRPSVRLTGISLLTLLVAGAWLWVTWAPMYSWVHQKLALGELHIMMSTPKASGEGAGPEGLGALLGGQPKASEPAAASDAPKKKKRSRRDFRKTQVAQAVLPVCAYGWLVSMSLTGMWLTMAGAAGVSRGRVTTRWGAILLLLACLGAIGLGWYVYREYRWLESTLPAWVKPTMLTLLIGLPMGLGIIARHRAVMLLRMGSSLVVLSALVSVAAIYSAVRWGMMPAEGVGPELYGKVFGVQSAFGWLLLLGTWRLRPET